MAELWWETTHTYNLNSLETLYEGKGGRETRHQIRKALILENCLMTLIYILFTQMADFHAQKTAALKKIVQAVKPV